MQKTSTSRLVRAGDLNHHGTLFAGQMAMWMVEACFVAAAKANGKTDNIVCINVSDLVFKRPVNLGEVIDIATMVSSVGKSSLTVTGTVFSNGNIDNSLLETTVTFVTLGPDKKPKAHGIKL
jgi:acyl-CoA hydrolase